MMGLSSRWLLASAALASACQIEIDEAEPQGSFAAELETNGGHILEPAEPWYTEPPCPSWPTRPCREPAAQPGQTRPSFVDPYPELLLLDPALLRGPLADNGSLPGSAPLSFRAQMSWLGGARDAYDFTRSWLGAWSSVSEVGEHGAPVTPRLLASTLLHDGWVTAAGAAYAGAGAPDWTHAPFELIAVLNRVDLAAAACSGPAGELRYVYAAVEPQTRAVLDVTLIVEVPYPTTRPAAEWARAWQELAEQPPQARADLLAALALAVQLEADPLRVRVRSNELGLAEQQGWELREFQVAVQAGALALVPAALEFTPRADVDPARLSEHVLAHADEIRGGPVSLPEELRAGAASTASEDFSWPVLGVSEGLREAFSRQTCNGCHGGDTRTLPFRHIAAAADLTRPAQLSPFLYEPAADGDELRRRAARQAELAATHCDTPAAEAAGYSGG